jgi:hypothetical protein
MTAPDLRIEAPSLRSLTGLRREPIVYSAFYVGSREIGCNSMIGV